MRHRALGGSDCHRDTSTTVQYSCGNPHEILVMGPAKKARRCKLEGGRPDEALLPLSPANRYSLATEICTKYSVCQEEEWYDKKEKGVVASNGCPIQGKGETGRDTVVRAGAINHTATAGNRGGVKMNAMAGTKWYDV